MKKFVYGKTMDGAYFWFTPSEIKIRRELDDRLSALFRDIKDEDLDEEE